MAGDEVKFAGEIVAVVAASSPEAAADAADLVWADIEPLPAVADIAAAIEPNAPLVFPDLGSNIIYRSERDREAGPFRWRRRRRASITAQPARGARSSRNKRRPRTSKWRRRRSLAWFSERVCSPERDRGVARNGRGEPQSTRFPIWAEAFGGKYSTYPEHVLVVAAARKLGRPVRWIEERRDNLSGHVPRS